MLPQGICVYGWCELPTPVTFGAAIVIRALDASCKSESRGAGVRSRPKLGLPMMPVLSFPTSYGMQIQ
jgi:hypothetical protein